VGYRSYGMFSPELCADCGKPVVQFLKRIEKQLKRGTHNGPPRKI